VWLNGIMKYLTSDPAIMGGDLVIKGTRIPIDVILYRLKDGYTLVKIHEMYPTPSLKKLNGAIEEAIGLLSSNSHGKDIA